MKRILLAALAAQAACTTWTEAGGLYRPDSERFSVELPPGWMRLRNDPELFATRDGPRLQRFDSLTVKVKKTASRTEGAAVARARLRSFAAPAELDILEQASTTLGGAPAFRIAYRWRTDEGLSIKGLLYGVVADGAVLAIAYTAPERYYFEHDLQTFERLRASFTVLPVEE